MAFEPKYIGATPLSFYGNYAAGYHITHNNKFDIHASDIADSGAKIHHFQITVHLIRFQ